MNAAPRVLVIPSWYPGPASPTAGIFIREQVTALSALCEVSVLHVDSADRASSLALTVEDGVTVLRSAVDAASLPARYFTYRRLGLEAFERLREEWGAPDIVHVQALWPAALIARAISRRYGIPYVVTEHSEEYLAQSARRLVRTPGMLPLVLRPLARASACTIAVSRFLGNRLVELGLASDPVIIPNVVPLSDASPLAFATPHVIAHVSVMGPAKNLPGLLHAIDALRVRRSDFVLRLAGEGERRAEAEALSASLGLDDFVEFIGPRTPEQVRALFAESAFAVISSTHETFSVVAVEALMCGRPVLSTRCGGPEEFITPEVGRLVASDDVAALADGLDWMLDHHADFDPAALHEYARKRFAPDVVATAILDVYRSVLDA
ncbi:MAG: glycosyltransferase [Actinomycetia bacterium]|nr:glycosyltransferase [Actinomycetes bacterium]